MSQSKSDPFDAWVLSDFLRTDHGHLRPLAPNSEQAQELKLLTRDQQRMVRHKTRLLNQLKFTLKEYYPRPVEVFGDLESRVAVDFLKQYSTPTALSKLSRKQWSRFAEQHPHLGKARSAKLWEELKKPQLVVPDHVVRAKAQLLEVLLDQLEASLRTVEKYSDKVERFFASTPAARLVEKLPGGKSGTLLPALWAELGDAPARWESFKHLQAEAGAVPVTKAAFDLVREPGMEPGPAQIAIALWLLDRAGEPPTGMQWLVGAGQPDAGVTAAAARFAALPPEAQRAWLNANFQELRAGLLELDDLP